MTSRWVSSSLCRGPQLLGPCYRLIFGKIPSRCWSWIACHSRQHFLVHSSYNCMSTRPSTCTAAETQQTGQGDSEESPTGGKKSIKESSTGEKGQGEGQVKVDKDDAAGNVGKIKEVGGPRGYEPTRYGDWAKNGRVSDF